MPYSDRFYPIVDSLAWVERLTRLGVRMVPLRAKNLAHEDAVRRHIHRAGRQ
jgi:thiamine-phosphate pyrophosphorylase